MLDSRVTINIRVLLFDGIEGQKLLLIYIDNFYNLLYVNTETKLKPISYTY